MEPVAIRELVYKHDEDLYRGDPAGTGIVSRLVTIEKSLERQSKNIDKFIVGCGGAVLAEILYRFLVK